MGKGTLLLAAILAVGFASAADAAARKAAPAMDPGLRSQEQSFSFIRAGMQPWTTTYAPAAKSRAARKSSKRR